MQHFKIIFIVIASPSHFYNKNKLFLNKFMNSHPNVKTLFIYGNVDKSQVLQTKHDLYFDCPENLRPGILIKTIKAFEYIKKNYTYDYVVRTNISTFWNIRLLLRKLKFFPNKRFIAGETVRTKYKRFISGTGIILSKDLINILIKNKNKLNYQIPDDVMLSQYLHNNHKIRYYREPRCDKYIKRIPLNKRFVPRHFTSYRLKTKRNRNLDSYKIFKLWKFFYK